MQPTIYRFSVSVHSLQANTSNTVIPGDLIYPKSEIINNLLGNQSRPIVQHRQFSKPLLSVSNTIFSNACILYALLLYKVIRREFKCPSKQDVNPSCKKKSSHFCNSGEGDLREKHDHPKVTQSQLSQFALKHFGLSIGRLTIHIFFGISPNGWRRKQQ